MTSGDVFSLALFIRLNNGGEYMEEFLADYISMGGNGIPSPFTLYLFILLVANTCRFVLVIRPLWKASRKFDKNWINEMWFGLRPEQAKIDENKEKAPKKGIIRKIIEESNVTGLKSFLIRESIILLLPISAVIILRGFLLPPAPYIKWNQYQIISFLFFMSIWIAWDLMNAIGLRKSIKSISSKYAVLDKKFKAVIPVIKKEASFSSPYNSADIIKLQAQGILGIRTVLDQVSNLSTVSHKEYSETDSSLSNEGIKSTLSKIKNRSLNEIENILISTRNSLVNSATTRRDVLDEKIQEKVDEIIRPTNKNRLISALIYIATIFGPLFLIWGFLPSLGGV